MSGNLSFLLSGQHYGSAVGIEFGGTGGYAAGSKSDVYNSICSKLLSLTDHALGGFATRLYEQFRITFEFAAKHVFKAGGNIPTDMFSANGAALDQTFDFQDFPAGYILGVNDDHVIAFKEEVCNDALISEAGKLEKQQDSRIVMRSL